MRVEPARRRRIVLGLAALLAVLTTASCATGKQAETSHETPAIDGTGGSVGAIQLHAVAIAAPTGAQSYAAGASAQLMLVIVNTGTTDDTLVGVSTPAAANVSLFASTGDASAALAASPSAPASTSAAAPSASTSASASGSASTSASASASPSASSSTAPQPLSSLAIPAGQRVSLGISGTDKVLMINGLLKPLFPATTLSITFNFGVAGSVTLAVPVQLTAGATRLTIPPLTGAG